MNFNSSKTTDIGLPNRDNASRNQLVEVVLLVIVCVLFGWFIVLPKKADLDAKKADLAQVQQAESQTSSKLATLKQLSDALKSDQTQVSELDEALPLNGNTLHLRSLITSLAQSVGVTVSSVDISSQESGPVAGDKALLANPFGATRTVQKLSGSVFVVGTFNQVLAFLQKLEDNSRIMDVTSLTINSAPEGLLNLQINLNAYYFAQ